MCARNARMPASGIRYEPGTPEVTATLGATLVAPHPETAKHQWSGSMSILVEGAGGLAHPEGIAVLVEHVGGHRQRRAGREGVERLDGEPGRVEGDEHSGC
jgi:hypothetical protein